MQQLLEDKKGLLSISYALVDLRSVSVQLKNKTLTFLFKDVSSFLFCIDYILASNFT